MKTINRIFFRSFFLQATWNYELMQGVGYLYCIFPKLRELYNDPGELQASCLRHLNYFNTNPYMVSFVLGANARAEEDSREKVPSAASDSTRFKLQMGGPLAALGDKIFWSTLRPLIGLIAVLGLFLNVRPQIIVPLSFILIFNIPIIYFRYRGLISSYTGKSEMVDVIRKINSNFMVRLLPTAGLLVVALCILAAFFQWGFLRGSLLFFFTVVVATLYGRFKISVTLLFYLVSLAVFSGGLIVQ